MSRHETVFKNTTERIHIKLPRKNPGQLYQLVHIGSITHNQQDKEDFEVEIFFQLKEGNNYEDIVSHKIYVQKVTIRYLPSLIVGSLWNSHGIQIQGAQNSFLSTRSFEISKRVKTFQLKEILLGCKNLDGLLTGLAWKDALESFYCQISFNSEQILISCNELVRALYYRDIKLVNLFFSRADIKSYGVVLQKPNISNNYCITITSKIFLSGLSAQMIFAELLANKEFLKQAMISHSNLFIQMQSQLSGKGRISYNFRKSAHCKLSVTGFPFTSNRGRFFMVCSIVDVEGLFSFTELKSRKPKLNV